MKKLLLSMAAMSLVAVAAHAQENWEVQSRAGWTVLGCSQQNNGAASATVDGGFPHIIDDNTNTYWHSCWEQGAGFDAGANHYLIFDRGENAGSFGGFSYLPRQSRGGNGYVTEYALYAVDALTDDVLGSTCSTSESKTLKGDSHLHMTEFLKDFTPVAEGSFDYKWEGNSGGDVTDHNERRVKLDATATGRYVIFLIKDATGAERETGTPEQKARVWGNCAEFNLYTVEVEDNREAAQALLDSAIDHMTPGYFSKEHAEYAPLAEALKGEDNGAINVAYRAASAADLTQASTSALYFISSNAGEMVTTAAGAPLTAETVAEHNESAMWGFVEVAGKMYLYNAATKELANVWGTSEEANGTFWYGNPEIGSAFTLALGSDNNVIGKADGSHGLAISANAVADANAEIHFEWAAEADAEVTAGLVETIKETCANIDAAIVASYEGENTVGHYTDDAAALVSGINSPYYAQKAYMLAETLKAGDELYIQFEAGKVYTFTAIESDMCHFVANGKHTFADFDDNLADNNYYWVCNIDENGVHTFTHKVIYTGSEVAGQEYPESANEKLISNQRSTFRPERADLGVMRLNPNGAEYLVMLIPDASADDASSEGIFASISEITAEGAAQEQWYDLQGRRVAAGARGFIISSNGSKVIR